MVQILLALLFVFLTKFILDSLKPIIKQKQAPPKNDYIDISEKWINADDMPYQKIDSLLNTRELAMFKMLQDTLAKTSYVVYPHVPMADLLTVPAGTQNRQEYLFRLKERSLDVVIFDSFSLRPILAVNLQSRVDGKRQQISNQFIANALRSADLKSIEIDLNTPPTADELLRIMRRAGLAL